MTGLLVTGGVAWLVAGPPGAAVAVMVVAVSPMLARRRRRARSRRCIDAEIATVFEVAARSVRAGAAVPEALQSAARSVGGAGGREVTASSRSSRSVDGGVWAGLDPGPDDDRGAVPTTGSHTDVVVAAVMAMVRGAAGGGARGLEAGAMLLREHERSRVEIESGAAHARASAVVLVAVPVIFGGAALLSLPGAAGGVLSHPAVLGSVVVGLCLEAAGAAWTARLVRSVQGGQR